MLQSDEAFYTHTPVNTCKPAEPEASWDNDLLYELFNISWSSAIDGFAC